jgi:flagellar biosynthesis/type III secretory pathway chaperone
MDAPRGVKEHDAATQAALDERVARLARTFEDLIGLQQRFVGVLQHEKALIIEGDLDRLAVCLAEKEALLVPLRQLDAQWRDQIDPIARLAGHAGGGMSLGRLIELVGEPHRSRLRSCQQRLAALKASMVEINQVNGLLIEKTLKKIDDLMELLRHLSCGAPTYQPTGLLSQSRPPGRLLCKG